MLLYLGTIAPTQSARNCGRSSALTFEVLWLKERVLTVLGRLDYFQVEARSLFWFVDCPQNASEEVVTGRPAVVQY